MSERLLKESDVMRIAFQLPLVVNSAFADAVKAIPSADRLQGEVDAVEIYEKAESQLERNEITVGEFEKIIEPLKHLSYGTPQGEWIDNGRNLWGCSNCGMEIYSESEQDRNEYHKWCSRCGARMKGADDE